MINKILYVALAALWLQSCELLPIDYKVYYLFSVENQTEYKMDIEAYEKGKLIEKIHLDPGKATERVRVSDEPDLFKGGRVDSAIIRFGGLRQIIQYCDGNALAWGNQKCPEIIKNLGEYATAIHERIKKKIGRKKVVKKVSYIFDSTDFDRAEPIQE